MKANLCRRHGIGSATFHNRNAKGRRFGCVQAGTSRIRCDYKQSPFKWCNRRSPIADRRSAIGACPDHLVRGARDEE